MKVFQDVNGYMVSLICLFFEFSNMKTIKLVIEKLFCVYLMFLLKRWDNEKWILYYIIFVYNVINTWEKII